MPHGTPYIEGTERGPRNACDKQADKSGCESGIIWQTWRRRWALALQATRRHGPLPPTHFPGVRLRPLGHLSVGRGLTRVWWHWLISFTAHAMIGVVIGRFCPRLWWPAFTLLVLKEGFGDIPNDGWSWLVILDSLSDQFAASIGYFMLHIHSPNRSKQFAPLTKRGRK